MRKIVATIHSKQIWLNGNDVYQISIIVLVLSHETVRKEIAICISVKKRIIFKTIGALYHLTDVKKVVLSGGADN